MVCVREVVVLAVRVVANYIVSIRVLRLVVAHVVVAVLILVRQSAQDFCIIAVVLE